MNRSVLEQATVSALVRNRYSGSHHTRYFTSEYRMEEWAHDNGYHILRSRILEIGEYTGSRVER